MKIMIMTVGKPKIAFARDGFAEYIKRMSRFHKVDVIHCDDKVTDDRILQMIDNRFCVVLDEHGVHYTSCELAMFLRDRAIAGIGEIVFIIGGPDGHFDRVKKRADVLWSMGKLTFPHDLAMMIMAEALYRASTINAGHPYHRE